MCFKEVPWAGIPIKLLGASRKFQGRLKGDSMEFKWVSMLFQKKFNRCLREVLMVFQGFFKEVFRVLQGRLRGVPRDISG